ncbi:MAG: crossover junction endodeoxyribonuclease RuvC [Candidatus Omnitrophota bacterium]
MLILGVDPGLRVSGYGLITGSAPDLKLVQAGVIVTNSQQAIQQRLDTIYGSLDKLAEEFKPQILVLEKIYAHYRHPATSFLLGHARGVICLLAAQKKIQLFEYLPTRVKKAVVGRGHSGKAQVRDVVRKILRIKEASFAFDISDALALAIAHAWIKKACLPGR